MAPIHASLPRPTPRQLGGCWLWGGAGSDVFVFGALHGNDRIVDFVLGVDKIQLAAAGQDYEALRVTAVGENAMIDTGSGTIVLDGVAPSSLSSYDFIFS